MGERVSNSDMMSRGRLPISTFLAMNDEGIKQGHKVSQMVPRWDFL